MNEEKLREILNKELDDKVPNLSNKILATPIHRKDSTIKNKTKTSLKEKIREFFVRKRNWAFASAAIACMLIVVLSCVLFIPNRNNTQDVSKYTCYVVEINPCVSFTADENGKVQSIYAVNEDGNVIISSNEITKGMAVDDCLRKIADLALKFGYLDSDSTENAIKVSVTNNDSKKSEKLINDTKKCIEKFYKEKGVFGFVVAQNAGLDDVKELLGYSNASSLNDVIKETLNKKSYTFEEENVTDLIKTTVEQVVTDYVMSYKEGVNSYVDTLFDIVDVVADDMNFWALVDERYSQPQPRGQERREEEQNMQGDPSTEVQLAIDALNQISKYVNTIYPIENITDVVTYNMVKAAYDVGKNSLFGNLFSELDEIKTKEDLINYIKDKEGENSQHYNEIMSKIEKVPTKASEYIEKAKEKVKSEMQEKIEQNRSKYDQIRSEISESDYEQYIQRILEEYSSLSDYYKHLKEQN